MLYESWRQIAHSCPKQIALRDLVDGRLWTFEELQTQTESVPATEDSIIFPQGNSAEFILSVLRAWRAEKVVCPLESGISPLSSGIGRLTELGPLPKSVVHLKTTSATTGSPRWVAFTADQLIADMENIVSTMALSPERPNVGVISLAHSYGFSNLVLPLLLRGIPLILAGSALPEALRRACAFEPEVTVAGVPALWARWHDANVIPGNIRVAISAGAPLPLTLEQAVFEQRGLKIHNFYGSSECGGIAYDKSNEPRRDSVCAGGPLANVAVAVNESGCLEVRGRAVGEAYWPEPGANLRDGVFVTSDLAEIAGQLIYLRGRASDQINVAGRKVSPEVIEEVLASHPDVRECVTFGVTGANLDRGETIVACLSIKSAVNADMLKQFLITKLPAWQVPREWWFVESLDANNRGKLSRVEWRNKYLETIRRRNGSAGCP